MVKKVQGLTGPTLAAAPRGDPLAPAADLDGSILPGEAIRLHRLGRAVDGFTVEGG